MKWPRCYTAGHRRGSRKCRGWPALRLWRNFLKETLASLATACFANSPNSSKSWLPLARSSSALDDLHWSDDSTLSLLELLARRDDPAQLMLIGTYRPAEATRARQPLEALAQGMKIRGQCRVVRPDLLSADAVQSLIDTRTSRYCSRSNSRGHGAPADRRESTVRPGPDRPLEGDLRGSAAARRLAGGCRFRRTGQGRPGKPDGHDPSEAGNTQPGGTAASGSCQRGGA